MNAAGHGSSGAVYAGELRRELSQRAQAYAAARGLRCSLTRGEMPMAAFGPSADGSAHGNFLDRSWRAIQAEPAWRRRLQKAHTQGRTALPAGDRGPWKELDTCASSDALLMNVFCHPGVVRGGTAARLGVEPGARPAFGVPARVPFADGKSDRTEVDMRLGDLLVEAKLTESDFQSADAEAVERYRDFAAVFDRRLLPRRRGRYLGYQLIRNVLAAEALACSFCVLLDARRPDLLEGWYAVMRAVRGAGLRVRCKVLTWQELAQTLPRPLQRFLEEKYGIRAATAPL